MERKGLKVVQHRIDILESRINSITVESWNSEVYSYRQFCLHSYLLLGEYANRYFLLSQDMYRQREDWQIDHPQKPFPEPGIEWRESIVEKTWNVLETGFHVASNQLPINDVIRLFLSYEYCCFLWKHGGEPQEAKATAMQVYEDASALSFELTVDQLLILGKIREELLISKRPRSLLQAYGENDEDDVSENQDGGEEMAKLDSFRVTRKKSVKFAQLDKLRESRWNVGVFNHNLEVATLIKKYLGPSISSPTYLESIPSSSIILKTVDKIFRAYIRGNALPGQQTSGNTVDLAGHNISFGAFLLNGPYMSWKGFLQFLLDFGVVKLPSQQSKHGQKFWKTMSILQVNPANAAVSDTNSATGGNSQVEPVLTLKEAALIFIQSSCAGHSALISRRTNNQRTHDNDDEGKGLNPDHVEAESWQLVTQWAENDGDSEWEIDVGTNFSQFLDCLGKIGIVAYSKDPFPSILPTTTERITHFLSAFLGLTDQRKWFTKVQKKLKNATIAIKEVAEKAKAITSKKTAQSSDSAY